MYLSNYVFIYISSFYLSIYLSLDLSIYLSIYLSVISLSLSLVQRGFRDVGTQGTARLLSDQQAELLRLSTKLYNKIPPKASRTADTV
jgi:hypothetical protein